MVFALMYLRDLQKTDAVVTYSVYFFKKKKK